LREHVPAIDARGTLPQLIPDPVLTPCPRKAPVISNKLKALTTAMMSGGYAAEEARKLFEALCRTVDHKTYETLVPLPTSTSPTVGDPPARQ
jgi:hypothetical protein